MVTPALGGELLISISLTQILRGRRSSKFWNSPLILRLEAVALFRAKLLRQGSFAGLGLPCEFRAFWSFKCLNCGLKVSLGLRALSSGSFCGLTLVFLCILLV